MSTSTVLQHVEVAGVVTTSVARHAHARNVHLQPRLKLISSRKHEYVAYTVVSLLFQCIVMYAYYKSKLILLTYTHNI